MYVFVAINYSPIRFCCCCFRFFDASTRSAPCRITSYNVCYTKLLRFWHWTQAFLILFLALTGFEIHSSFSLMGFESAVYWHNFASWALIVLIIFAIFWHFTTGEWRQYIPTRAFIRDQIRYYITGIFKNAPHPTKKSVYNKFNPLQRIIYLGLKVLVIPVQA